MARKEITKVDMVRDAIDNLGWSAKPDKYVEYIKSKYKVKMTKAHITQTKSAERKRRGVRRRKRKDRAGYEGGSSVHDAEPSGPCRGAGAGRGVDREQVLAGRKRRHRQREDVVSAAARLPGRGVKTRGRCQDDPIRCIRESRGHLRRRGSPIGLRAIRTHEHADAIRRAELAPRGRQPRQQPREFTGRRMD